MSDANTCTNSVQLFTMPPSVGDYTVRVVTIDGEPWFVAADVVAALDLDRTATRRLEDDEKGVHSTHTPGGQQELTVINESGLYSLILGSRKPEAKVFKRWVTGEVLPQIRKTGTYGTPRELTRLEILQLALKAEEERAAAEAQAELWEGRARTERAALEEAKPKIEAHDDLISAEGHYSLARAAQILGLGRERFIERLAEFGLIIFRPGHSDHLRPYQAQIKAGRFVVKARQFKVFSQTDQEEQIRTEGTTYVTPKGLTHIRTLLNGGRSSEGRLI